VVSHPARYPTPHGSPRHSAAGASRAGIAVLRP
jgi:hypothetical protein